MRFGLPWSKQFIDDLKDKEFRDDFVADRVRTRIALQIRALRESRGWTQKDLAEHADKKQSVISRIEDPDYEGVGLQTLFDVAAAFGLPLWVDMPEWDEWARRINEIATWQLQRTGFEHLDDRLSVATTTTLNKPYVFFAENQMGLTQESIDILSGDDEGIGTGNISPAYQLVASRA